MYAYIYTHIVLQRVSGSSIKYMHICLYDEWVE